MEAADKALYRSLPRHGLMAHPVLLDQKIGERAQPVCGCAAALANGSEQGRGSARRGSTQRDCHCVQTTANPSLRLPWAQVSAVTGLVRSLTWDLGKHCCSQLSNPLTLPGLSGESSLCRPSWAQPVSVSECMDPDELPLLWFFVTPSTSPKPQATVVSWRIS